jgi:hypothetical protein
MWISVFPVTPVRTRSKKNTRGISIPVPLPTAPPPVRARCCARCRPFLSVPCRGRAPCWPLLPAPTRPDLIGSSLRLWLVPSSRPEPAARLVPVAGLSPLPSPSAYDGGSPQRAQSSPTACPHCPLCSPPERAATALPSAYPSPALCCVVGKKGKKTHVASVYFKCFKCF